MTIDDADEIESRARAGDPAAFGALIRRHDRELRSMVWAIVRSGPDTDDVMQDAYEKAFRAVGAFDGRSAFKTWLYSICYRTAIDHLRYEGRRRHVPLDEVAATPGPGSAEGAAMARVELAAAFELLDIDQSVALMLTAGLGFSYDEAAQITGMRRGTVASKASRARQRLEREVAR